MRTSELCGCRGQRRFSRFSFLILLFVTLVAFPEISVAQTPPTVVGVTSSLEDGTYRIGDIIPVEVSFDGTVTVSGAPRLLLETGDADRYAEFASGSGSAALVFNYTVQEGDSTPDLDYGSAASLELNGGSIKDATQAVNADLQLPVPGAEGSLGAAKAIYINGIRPDFVSCRFDPRENFVLATFSGYMTSSPSSPFSPLSPEKFSIIFNQNGGTATGVQIAALQEADGSELDASDDSVIRFVLTISGQAAGVETIAIVPAGEAMVYDTGGNSMSPSASSGEILLHVKKTIFVNWSASGNNDGTSWVNAFSQLYDAIPVALTGDEIWVAAGIYKPTAGSDRSVSFVLKDGVSVYGGFGGSEDCLGTRDWAGHETILSGDIGVEGDDADNSCHVVVGASDSVLDGFTITLGNANESGFQNGGGIFVTSDTQTIRNCVVSNCKASIEGGGLFVGGALKLSNIVFQNNQAQSGGGICFYSQKTLAMSNCVFISNSAQYGGGVRLCSMNSNVSKSIVNCTFFSNSATQGGGVFSCHGGNYPTIANTVFSGNTGTGNSSYVPSGSPPVQLKNSFLDNGFAGVYGGFIDLGGNLSGDALFVDSATPAGPDSLFFTNDDGLAHQETSQCVNSGSETEAPGTDILGVARPQGSGVDMGAYERDPAVPLIQSATLASDNSYVEITFSEAVYGLSFGIGELQTSDFTLVMSQNGGGVSATAIGSLKTTSGTELSWGETTVRAMLTLTGTPTGVETIEIRPADGASIYDKAGNPLSADQTTGPIALNSQTAPPAVTSVSSTTPDGVYRAGESITVAVAFTESVTVTGSPRLALECGAGRYAVFNGGSGSSTLAFTVSIQPGDAAVDLDYPSSASLELNGGTIVSAANSASANLSLPAPGGAGSLSVNSSVSIDTAAPQISAALLASDNSYLDVTFSEGVYTTDGSGGLTAADFQYTFKNNPLDGGGVSDFSVTSATRTDGEAAQGGETTVRLHFSVSGTPTGVETIEIYPGGTSIFDLAGNPAPVSPTTGQVNLNSQVGPTVASVSSPTPDGIYKASDTIAVTVTFSEAVTVSGTPRLALNCGAGRYADYSGGTGGTALGFTYSVQSGDAAADLDYASIGALELNGGAISSAANSAIANRSLPEPGAAGSLGANKAIIVDAALPVIQSGTLGPLNAYVELTFSEGVFGTGTGVGAIELTDISLVFASNGGTATAATATALKTVAGADLSGGETTVRVLLSVTGAPSGSETVEIRPAGVSSVFDRAGNPMDSGQTTGPRQLLSTQVKTLVSIGLSQNTATLAVSTTLNLTSITVTATYSDDTQAQVSGSVWTLKSGGGSVSGTTYQAPSTAGSTVLACTYTEGGVSKTADLAVTVTAGSSEGKVAPAAVSSSTDPLSGYGTSKLSDGIKAFNGDFALRHLSQVTTLTFDLGRTYLLTSIKHYNDGQYGAKSVIVETASAAAPSSFSMVTSISSLKVVSGTPNLDTLTLSPVSARYLRFKYTAYNDQSWFQLNEIEVYGTPDTAVTLSGISLFPSSLTLDRSESYDLGRIAVKATYSDGSQVPVTGVSWGFKSGGGSLSDTTFIAPAAAGVSTLTCSYAENGATKTADLGITTTAEALVQRVPVSASSSITAFKDYGPARLYDGTQTYNSDFVVLNRGAEVLVTIDLGSDRQVSKFKHYNDGEYGAMAVRIEAASAANPLVFIEAGSFEGLSVGQGAPNLDNLTITPVTARYFRFRYASFNNSFWFQVNEIQIFGIDTGASVLDSIALSPATVQVTSSTTYDLSKIGVKAFYADLSWSSVSAVTWTKASGSGSVSGKTYIAPAAPQTVTLSCSYTEGGVTRTAILTVSVIEAELEPLTIFGATCTGVPYPGYGLAKLYDQARAYNGDFVLRHQNLETSVILDLGYDMKFARIRHYNDGEYGAASVSLETASTSAPNSFSVLKTVNGLNVTAGSSNEDTIDFTQTTARYVKFRYYGFNDSIWFQLNEIEILGPSGQAAGTGEKWAASSAGSSMDAFPGYGPEKLIDGTKVSNGDFACINSGAEVSLSFDLGADRNVGVIRFINDGQWGAGSVTVKYAVSSAPESFTTAQTFTGLAVTQGVPALNTLTLSAPATGRYFTLQCGSFSNPTYFQANEVEFFAPPVSSGPTDSASPLVKASSLTVRYPRLQPLPADFTSPSTRPSARTGHAGPFSAEPAASTGPSAVLDLTRGKALLLSENAREVFARRGMGLTEGLQDSRMAVAAVADDPVTAVLCAADGVRAVVLIEDSLRFERQIRSIEGITMASSTICSAVADALKDAGGASIVKGGSSIPAIPSQVEGAADDILSEPSSPFGSISPEEDQRFLAVEALNALDRVWNGLNSEIRIPLRETLTEIAAGGAAPAETAAGARVEPGPFLEACERFSRVLVKWRLVVETAGAKGFRVLFVKPSDPESSETGVERTTERPGMLELASMLFKLISR